MTIGFDVGSYNFVTCKRDDKGKFAYKREVNAFLELPLQDRFIFNVMKDTRTPEFPNGVPIIELEKVAYILGEAATKMAYTMSALELKRPMVSGCVNPKEKDAFQIMSIMIHGLIDEISQDGETLYYCIPANAINSETDVEYHQKILDAIFKAYKSEKGYKVNAYPINEALALAYAELGHKSFTGISASFGSGMVNVCFAMFGSPVFAFSLVNSGDWIDAQAARATGESVAFINREKTKVDLSKTPTNLIERAINTQYRLMIEHTVNGIKKGFTGVSKTVRTDTPVDFVIAGGTASPPGFKTLFQETIMQANLPIKIGEIIKPNDPLFSVARGCAIAAESAK